MRYSGDLLKLNGKTIKKIVSYEIEKNKLWSSDTGRNMAGDNKGTLIGNFPKIYLEIGPTTDDELQELELILDASSFTCTYYNNKYKCACTGDFYAGSYKTKLRRKKDMTFKGFTVNLIPIRSEANHARSK